MSNLVLDNVNDMAWFNSQPMAEQKRLAVYWLKQGVELKLSDEDLTRIIILINHLNSAPLPFDELP